MAHTERMDHRGAPVPGRQKRSDYSQRALLCSPVGVNERPGGSAELGTANRIPHEACDGCLQFPIGLHLNRRVVGEKGLSYLREVVHMGTKDHRFTARRRLKNVVAAGPHKTPAHEDHGCNLVDICQFADRVEHYRVSARFRIDGEIGPPDGRQALRHTETLDLGEPFRVAGCQHQQRATAARPNPVERPG